MTYRNTVLDAVNTVLAMDIPDDAVSTVVNDRLRMTDDRYLD